MTHGAFIHLAGSGGGASAGCYRLDRARIGRFYTGQTRLMDKLRMLTGQPPMPMSRAIRVAGVAQT